MKIDGIELLKMIKDNKLKEGTKINVLFYDVLSYILVSELKFQDNELIWEPGTFRVAMLYDDNYMFEIIEEKPKEIGELDNRYFDEANHCYCGTRELGEPKLVAKINEIIDSVNYLLKKEDD